MEPYYTKADDLLAFCQRFYRFRDNTTFRSHKRANETIKFDYLCFSRMGSNLHAFARCHEFTRHTPSPNYTKQYNELRYPVIIPLKIRAHPQLMSRTQERPLIVFLKWRLAKFCVFE